MALMELIVIARCADAKGSANLLRTLAIQAFKRNGNVRELKVLGDRILSKQVMGNDGKKHIVGRYLQVIYDGNQTCKQALEATAKNSYETIRFQTHKVKDFYNDALFYKRTLEEHKVIVDQQKQKELFQNTLHDMANEKK